MTVPAFSRHSLARVLADAGCVAPAEEAEALLVAAAGAPARLDELVARRCDGEPLAWLVGHADFCEMRVRVARGVYVPRQQSAALAELAARMLPPTGTAVDLCTGAGAIAMVLQRCAPAARVVGTDPVAAACARGNGVDVRHGDLDAPLPVELEHAVDVMTGVLPYVPTGALRLLPRDVVAFEPRVALDGGERGTRLLVEAVRRSPRWLRTGGRLLLELGGDQAAVVGALMKSVGFTDVDVIHDADGDVRGIAARFAQGYAMEDDERNGQAGRPWRATDRSSIS
jgi:release factor glutamine methyltransferase